MNSWLLSPFLPRRVRPWAMKKIGCHVGKGCFIGYNVRIDGGHAEMIIIEDGVSVAGGTRLLCHQRDFKDYYVGSDYNVGAGSLVTKDIPAWTVATGRPAKVVKQIPKKEKEEQ